MTIARLSPETLHRNPVYSQLATVSSGMTLVVVGGQNGVTRDGTILERDVVVQTEQAFRNVQLALEAAGATFYDVFRIAIYLVHGQSLQDSFAAAQRVIPKDMPPPTVTVLQVVGLAHPDFLIEVEVMAAIPSQGGA